MGGRFVRLQDAQEPDAISVAEVRVGLLVRRAPIGKPRLAPVWGAEAPVVVVVKAAV